MSYIYDLTDTWNASGTVFNGIKLNVTNSASAAASKLVTLQIGGTEHFSVTKAGVGYFSGNLGVGTSSPSAKLQVNGGFAVQGVTFPSSGAGLEINWDGTQSVLQSYSRTSSAYQPLWLDGSFVRFNTSSVERMRIDTSGRVLIGTATGVGSDFVSIRFNSAGSYPQGLNMVDSNASASGTNFQVFRKSDDTYLGNIRRNSTDNAILVNGNSYLALGSGDTERMRIDSSGNLLVGTTSNTYGSRCVFASNGGSNIMETRQTGTGNQYHAIFINANGGVGSITTDGSATQFVTSSDVRLKDNIADADDAASLIDAIQVRKFDWKANGSHQRYGFVAQELVTVAPEAVSQPEDPDAMMGVDYSKLVPMLVKEIQSMRLRLAQLEGN